MKIAETLTFGTDLIFWRENGRVTDRGDYIVIETPDDPTYYFGNLLIFARAPRDGDAPRWRELFAKELGHKEGIRHEAFEWVVRDGVEAEIAGFTAAGFVHEENVALEATAVNPPPHVNDEIVIRAIESDEEWRAVEENQVACREEGWAEAPYRDHIARAFGQYRRMIAGGLGAWYGAFLDGRLAADLGLFWDGRRGRFQRVGTHPDFRRRGICGTLVHEICRSTLDERGLERLVMVADENYHAARIYASVGFRPTERTAAVCLRPPEAEA